MNMISSSLLRNTRDRTLSGPATARVTLDGREYINFSGASYLALGNLPELRKAAAAAIQQGAAFASQLPPVYEVVDPHIRDLEHAAADYCGSEDALYLASGYLIGMSALTSLDLDESVLFIDEGAHFNMFDAARLTSRPIIRFENCQVDSLREAIRNSLPSGTRPVVICDGLSGTTGRVAPLADYAELIREFDGRLVVDEAHSFGILGPNGRGAVDYHGVEAVSVWAATFSKAFCAQGAIIGCTRKASEKLKRVPPLRGANAGSPISAAVSAAALRYMTRHPERRACLLTRGQQLRECLKNIGISVIDSPAPVLAFQLGKHDTMRSLHSFLFERGIYVTLSNYIGAGPEGAIRCAAFADHSEEDFTALAAAIVDFRSRHGV